MSFQPSGVPASQRGPGTVPTTVTVAGVKVQFPCKAYPSQMAMMSKVITGLRQRKNCLLESPTGSGKSLALLCSALAWQRHEAERVEKMNAEIDQRNEDAVKAAMEEEMKRQKMQQDAKMSPSKPAQSSNVQMAASASMEGSDSSFDISFGKEDSMAPPVYDVTDDEDDDFKPTKRSRLSSTLNSRKNTSTLSDSSISFDNTKENSRTKEETQQGNAEEESPYFVPCEKKLTVPKIFFGTRTHKQIAQITRELRKTGYKNVRSVVLASRDHTCINPVVEKHPNKNEACRELIQDVRRTGNGCLWHAGAKKLASFPVLSNVGLELGYDLEDLVQIGRKYKGCPYYMSRFLMANADIIFCPYNYMIDPSIRKTMNLELNDHVLIFDEAHNMEDAAREASGFSLKQDEIQHAMQDCEKSGRGGMEPYAHSEIANMLSLLSQWMDNQVPGLQEKTFSVSGKCWKGTEFLGASDAFGLTEEKFKNFLTYFEAVKVQRDKMLETLMERGSRIQDEKPMISNQTISVIENVLKLFFDLSRDSGRFRDDFIIAMSRDTVRQRRDGNAGPFRNMQVLSLHLWCLNPAVAFQSLTQMAHSIVLTSGTLSPMQSFESELGTPFPLKLEANHVIDDSQVWASVIASGPNGVNLNGSYQNVVQFQYQDELGLIVLRVCEIMPHGVLCFFPSYRMLENMRDRWNQTGLLDRIGSTKTIVFEPRSGPDMFQEAMDTFYDSIKKSSMNGGRGPITGALFLAVCRGKVSEGLDFADNNARAVICVGIPFPNIKDMQVEMKREYNTKHVSRGLLNGGAWYEIQAFRALNQALGRCIRHRNDWGAILLVDDRYTRTPRYQQSLSKWIRNSVKSFPNWNALEESVTQFRDNMGSHPSFACETSAMEIDTREEQNENVNDSRIGMTNKGHGSMGFSGKASSAQSVPFADSYSSGGNFDGDFDTMPEKDAQSVEESVDKSPSFLGSSHLNYESTKGPNTATPVSIFGAKSRRFGVNEKSSPTTSKIGQLFANQLKKAKLEKQNVTEFCLPSNETLSESSLSQTSNSNAKRPRNKKLKL